MVSLFSEGRNKRRERKRRVYRFTVVALPEPNVREKMDCSWCHDGPQEDGVALCRACLDSWSVAYDSGWNIKDFEGLPFIVRYADSVTFHVHSQRNSHWYAVGHDFAEALSCSCPSRQYRPIEPCKHMQCVNAALIRRYERTHYQRGDAPLSSGNTFSLYR